MLSVTNLSKEYPTPRGPLSILEGVSFSLGPGEAAAIMGPSGSGKSSLLYVLGALEPPTSGTMTLDGRNPFELAPDDLAAFRNKSIGFVFQDHCLLPQCTVLENVLIPTLVAPKGEVAGAAGRGVMESARGLIGRVGLGDRIDHRPGELSGGERQRVAIARALIRQPRLLLCDEPTGNLDRASAENVMSLLLDLHRQQGALLIVVTHSPAIADKFPVRFDLVDRQLVKSRDPDPRSRSLKNV
ncbi:MAG: ABC transporter ATP-binding protein [Vicinamibacterales bacterium]